MSYNRYFRDLLAAMGLDSHKRLPDKATLPVVVEGVRYWIGEKKASMSLRVRCTCPVCGRELAAARLPQHRGTAACIERALIGVRQS